MSGEHALRNSFQSINSADSDEKSIRHFGIGGAGNVAEGRAASFEAPSSKTSGESERKGKFNKGLSKIVRHCGIGGAGNVAVNIV